MDNENKREPSLQSGSSPKGKQPRKRRYEKSAADLYKENYSADLPEEYRSAVPFQEPQKDFVKKRVLGIEKEDASIDKRQRVFKNVTTAIFILAVVAVLVYTFYNDFFASGRPMPDFEKVMSVLRLSWMYILFALIALFLCFFLKGLKLSVMCKSLTGRFHFRTCMETAIIGHYYNTVTPLAVGGQPFEIYHLSRHGVSGGPASSMPIAAFFLHQLAFVVLGVAALIMFKTNALQIPTSGDALGNPDIYSVIASNKVIHTLAIIGLVLCIILPTLTVIFSIMPKFGTKIVHFVVAVGSKLRIVKNPEAANIRWVKNILKNSHSLRAFMKKPLSLILSFLISIGEQLALCSLAYFSLKLFGFNVKPDPNGVWEWAMIVQISIILYSAVSFVPTPGNAGAADLSFYLLFSFSLSAGFAFPAMIVWRILSFYSFIIIGFIFNRATKRADARLKAEDPAAIQTDAGAVAPEN